MKDFFNDQEYIIPTEFSVSDKKFAYECFRVIKNNMDNPVYESPIGIEKKHAKKNKLKYPDIEVITWEVNRLIRRLGFTDKGASSGCWEMGPMEYDENRDTYYYHKKDYDIEHCRPIRIVALRLIAGYYYKQWDCDKSGKPTKGITFLQETVFKGIATNRVTKPSHLRITEASDNYTKDKGLDNTNFFVTLRDFPDRMQEVWEWFDQANHYEIAGVRFYPLNKMNILPYQKRIQPKHDKPHPGLVGNFQRFAATKIVKSRIKPYVKKKDRQPKITLESKGFLK